LYVFFYRTGEENGTEVEKGGRKEKKFAGNNGKEKKEVRFTVF